MGIADRYRVLADAIEDLEERGIDVTDVTQGWDDDLSVTIECRVPDAEDGTGRAADAASTEGDEDGSDATARAPRPRHPLVGVAGRERSEPVPVRNERTSVERRRGDAPGTERERATSSAVEADEPNDATERSGDATESTDDATEPSSDAGSGTTATDGGSPGTSDRADAPASDADGGSIPCRSDDCEATFENEHGMKIHYSKVHRGEGETPAYEDPDALREVYERHGTFAEMTAALDVDVSPNTVRRHMIEHGIHDPRASRAPGSDGPETAADDDAADRRERDADPGVDEADGSTDDPDDANVVGDSDDSNEIEEPDADRAAFDADSADEPGTERDGDDESNSVGEKDGDRGVGTTTYEIPDDVDLPRGVTVEDVATAVASAATVYEVGRDLRVSRERAHRLLRDLGLLDLVTGRLATRPDPDQVRREVDARLRNGHGDASIEAD